MPRRATSTLSGAISRPRTETPRILFGGASRPRFGTRSRLLSGLAAVVICAWFVLEIRQAHDTDRATALLDGHPRVTAAQAATIKPLLDGAALLNPDRTVDILRGQLSLARGHHALAQRHLETVVRAEPDNIKAWLWLAASSGDDQPLVTRALRQVHELEPKVPGGS